jgi:hypothetical protein
MSLSERDQKVIDQIILRVIDFLSKEDEIEQTDYLLELRNLSNLLDKKGVKSYVAKKESFLRLLLAGASDEIKEQGAILVGNLALSKNVKNKKVLHRYIPLLEGMAVSVDEPSKKAANHALSRIMSASVLEVSTPPPKPLARLSLSTTSEKKSPRGNTKAKVVKYLKELSLLGQSTAPVLSAQYESVLELSRNHMSNHINCQKTRPSISLEERCQFMLLRAFICCKARPDKKETDKICRVALSEAADTKVELDLDTLLESIHHTSDADKALIKKLWGLSKDEAYLEVLAGRKKRTLENPTQSAKKKQIRQPDATPEVVGRVGFLAKLLSSNEAEIKGGLEDLKKWAIDHPSDLNQFASNGVMDALLALLARDPASEHLLEILDRLTNAFNVQADNQAKMTEQAITKLAILLDDKDLKIKQYAAWALGNAAFNCEKNQALIKANPSCIDGLIKNLSPSEFEFGSEHVSLYAAWALAASGACADERYHQAIADSGGINHLKRYLGTLSDIDLHDKKVVQDAIDALEAFRATKRVRVEQEHEVPPAHEDRVEGVEAEIGQPVVEDPWELLKIKIEAYEPKFQALILNQMSAELTRWYRATIKEPAHKEKIKNHIASIHYLLLGFALNIDSNFLDEPGIIKVRDGFKGADKFLKQIKQCPEMPRSLTDLFSLLQEHITQIQFGLTLKSFAEWGLAYCEKLVFSPRPLANALSADPIVSSVVAQPPVLSNWVEPSLKEQEISVLNTWNDVIHLGATKMGEVLNEMALQLKDWYAKNVGNEHLYRDLDFVELNYRLVEYAQRINPALNDSALMSVTFHSDAKEAPRWNQPLYGLLVEKLNLINKRTLTFAQLLAWGSAYLSKPLVPVPAIDLNPAPAEERSLPDSIEPVDPMATSEPLNLEVKAVVDDFVAPLEAQAAAVVSPVPVQSPEFLGDASLGTGRSSPDIEEGEIVEEGVRERENNISIVWSEFFEKSNSKEILSIIRNITQHLMSWRKKSPDGLSEEQYSHVVDLTNHLSRYKEKSTDHASVFLEIKKCLDEINHPVFTLEKLLEWGKDPYFSSPVAKAKPASTARSVSPAVTAALLTAALVKEKSLVGGVDPSKMSEEEQIKLAMQESSEQAEKQKKIGPREIRGWTLKDVEDRGNCFYEAVCEQMKLIDHPYLKTIAEGTLPRDALRLYIQGVEFQDQEWADDRIYEVFIQKFDVILAIAYTLNPETGFECRSKDTDGTITNHVDGTPLPEGKVIIRLAATGNHFLSVEQHPELTAGMLRESFSPAIDLQVKALVNDLVGQVETQGVFVSSPCSGPKSGLLIEVDPLAIAPSAPDLFSPGLAEKTSIGGSSFTSRSDELKRLLLKQKTIDQLKELEKDPEKRKELLEKILKLNKKIKNLQRQVTSSEGENDSRGKLPGSTTPFAFAKALEEELLLETKKAESESDKLFSRAASPVADAESSQQDDCVGILVPKWLEDAAIAEDAIAAAKKFDKIEVEEDLEKIYQSVKGDFNKVEQFFAAVATRMTQVGDLLDRIPRDPSNKSKFASTGAGFAERSSKYGLLLFRYATILSKICMLYQLAIDDFSAKKPEEVSAFQTFRQENAQKILSICNIYNANGYQVASQKIKIGKIEQQAKAILPPKFVLPVSAMLGSVGGGSERTRGTSAMNTYA